MEKSTQIFTIIKYQKKAPNFVKEKKKSQFISDDIEISSEENSNREDKIEESFRLCKFFSEILEIFKLGAQKFHFSKYKKVLFLFSGIYFFSFLELWLKSEGFYF